jgi:tetratricopeptide (TPR) repeat protein
MRKLSFILALALVMFSAVSALAQRAVIRGKVMEGGQPVPNADIQLLNKENGQKYLLKTDKHGEFMNIGIAFGVYEITLKVNGQQRYQNFVKMDEDKDMGTIDLVKEQKAAQERAEQQLTPEQRKKIQEEREAQQREQNKVKNLNQMLADAKAAEESGNFEGAVQMLTQATQVDPNRDILWARLGSANLAAAAKNTDREAAKGQWTQAAEDYKKALALKPNDGGYHNNLGQAYMKLGQIDDAIKEYNTSAQLDPANAGMYYFNLGAVLTNANKPDDAIAAFDKALAIDPNRADAYYWKGVNLLAKATLKDNKMVAPPGTADALNKYLELQPQGQYAQPAKELLASIGESIQTEFKKKKK